MWGTELNAVREIDMIRKVQCMREPLYNPKNPNNQGLNCNTYGNDIEPFFGVLLVGIKWTNACFFRDTFVLKMASGLNEDCDW